MREPLRLARQAVALGRRYAFMTAPGVVAKGPPPRVFYGFTKLPAETDAASGGIVKFQRLARVFPNTRHGFNVVYLGSSSRPVGADGLTALAKMRGAKFAWNQNGVAYPAWAGGATEAINAEMRRLLFRADYVFFQSDFCRLSADRFLGRRREAWEVLHNSVDTTVFAPEPDDRPRRRPLTLLLGGSQYQWYRVDTALRTLAAVRTQRPDARLLVSGRLTWDADARLAERALCDLAKELGIEDAVELVGVFSQREAPALYARADLLLHTKVNDPCPSTVIEAMACGLPVVYSASGGVPELVGSDAGIGVPTPLDWERDVPPAPNALADAVLATSERLREYAAAARARAVERFDVTPWIQRHRLIFGELVR